MDIVLIHGFSSLRGEERLKLLIEAIKKEFPKAKIIIPNYLEKYGRFSKILAGRFSIKQYAILCHALIKKEESEGPMILIGYSLGGLIARILVERGKIKAKAAILVGTPNEGINLSRWEKWLLKILRKPCLKEMLPESPSLRYLNQEYKKERSLTNYYLIAGKEDKRVSLNSATGIIEAQEKIVIPTDHSGLIPKKYSRKPNAIWEIIKILKKEAVQNCFFYWTKFKFFDKLIKYAAFV